MTDPVRYDDPVEVRRPGEDRFAEGIAAAMRRGAARQ